MHEGVSSFFQQAFPGVGTAGILPEIQNFFFHMHHHEKSDSRKRKMGVGDHVSGSRQFEGLI